MSNIENARPRNPIVNAVELVPVSKLVTCKRCGCSDLAWVQFKTSGKWGLVKTSGYRPCYRGENAAKEAPRGSVYAVKFAHHRCEDYRAEQERIRIANEFKPADLLQHAFGHIYAHLVHDGIVATAFNEPMHPDAQAIHLLVQRIPEVAA